MRDDVADLYDLESVGWWGQPSNPNATDELWASISLGKSSLDSASRSAEENAVFPVQVAVFVDDVSLDSLPLQGPSASTFHTGGEQVSMTRVTGLSQLRHSHST